jgi:DNA replication protein DnaC
MNNLAIRSAIPQQPSPPTDEKTCPPTPPSSDGDCGCGGVGIHGWKTPIAGYPLSECKFCSCEKGQAIIASYRALEAKRHQHKLQSMFVNAGIPLHFRDFTVATLMDRAKKDRDKQPAIAAALELMDKGYLLDEKTTRYKFGLVLSGDFGRGKTGLLSPVLRHFIEQGKSGLWIEVYDFFTEVQKGYSTGDSVEKLEAAQRADVVLLDDLGDKARKQDAFAETDDRRRILYQLVNHRHNHGLPMLITTNLTGPELGLQFGNRTLERILESCAWVNMGGKNLRLE